MKNVSEFSNKFRYVNKKDKNVEKEKKDVNKR